MTNVESMTKLEQFQLAEQPNAVTLTTPLQVPEDYRNQLAAGFVNETTRADWISRQRPGTLV